MKPNADRPEVKDDLKTLPMLELEAKLGSSPDGLSQAEAQKRLTQYGPNEIEEKKTNAFLKFLSYFWGPIPWMIEVAVILSGAVRHWPDFFIILLLLVSNAVVGFWEESQAGNAIAALKAKLAIKARVKRDGKWITPPAREVVPGVRAGLIHETFSAHQGVEDDNMNVICLGGLVVGQALAWELVKTFLAARFSGAERHRRRLAKVAELEN